MWKELWLDQCGAILSAELVLIMVLLVIGLIVGLTALRDAIALQLGDVAGAVAALDPGFEFGGLTYNSNGAFGGTALGGGIFGSSVFGSQARVNGSSFTPVELPTQPTAVITALPPRTKPPF